MLGFYSNRKPNQPNLLLHPLQCILAPSSPDVFLSPTSLLHSALSVSHGVLAKFLAELLDEQSQLASSLRLLFQELVAEARNILLYLLEFTWNGGAHTDTHWATCQTNLPMQSWGLLTQELLTFVDFVALSVHLSLQDVAFNQALHDILWGRRDEEASKWWQM